MEEIKKTENTFLEMKTTIFEIKKKTTLNEIGRRLWLAKEKASKLEVIATEMIFKKETERLGGKNDSAYVNYEFSFKWPHICRRVKWRGDRKNIWKNNGWIFSKFLKTINPRSIQEV